MSRTKDFADELDLANELGKIEGIARIREVLKPEHEALAHSDQNPVAKAAGTLGKYSDPVTRLAHIPLERRTEELERHIKAVNAGDLSRPEAMLTAQAHALDAIFHRLAQEAVKSDCMETLLRLAFKAQSQCSRTLEVLAAIKNPPVVFAKQANIAHGPQQVNNGIQPEASRAEKPENQQTQLLTVNHGETLDNLGTGQASGLDTNLEAVGAIHRAEDGSR